MVYSVVIQQLPLYQHIPINLLMIRNLPIKVAIKIKPTSNDQSTITQVNPNLQTLKLNLTPNQAYEFKVDKIYDANTNKHSLFQCLEVNSLVKQFIKGYNISVISYGQTGSGKTYAMEGDNKFQGIIPMSIQYIYQQLPNSIITISYLQIYNEKIYDLINWDQSMQKSLKLRWESDSMFVVEDLEWKECHNLHEAIKWMKLGVKNRVVCSNKINQLSSRSHSIFMVSLESTDEVGNLQRRQAVFVDLAGSERMLNYHSNKLSRESIEINKSLFCLRKVIKILQEASETNKQLYVPYRDSKLTSLLKRCLGGNCQSMLIACIESNSKCIEETLSTLAYAVSTRKIKNYVSVQIDHQAKELKYLREKNMKLQRQLQLATKQFESYQKFRNQSQKKKMEDNEMSHRIIQCISTVRQLLQSNKQLRQQLEAQKAINQTQKLQLQQIKKQNKALKKIARKQSQSQIINIHNKQQSLNKAKNNPQLSPNYRSSKSVERYQSKTKLKKTSYRIKNFKYIQNQLPKVQLSLRNIQITNKK